MRWVGNIHNLSYYHVGTDTPCYCEQLISADDIFLQGKLNTTAATGYSLTVNVYSPDGLTLYEDATDYFDWMVGVNPYGGVYFLLQAKSYSPAMCQYQCWVLRVTITVNGLTAFDMYTDQYCKAVCCELPKGITFTGGQTCEVFVNNVNKVYLYDVVTNTATLLYTGVANYTDIALMNSKLYLRDGFTGSISSLDWDGTSLTNITSIGTFPTGAALGTDGIYLYIDDGNTIKRIDVSTSSLSTVVSDLGGDAVQGDIVVLNNGDIMVTQDDGSGAKINVYSGGVLSDTYPSITDGSSPLDDIWGMFFRLGTLYLMTKEGRVYTFNYNTGQATLVSTSLNAILGTNWNGAAQNYNCEGSTVELDKTIKPSTETTNALTLLPYAVNCGKPLISIKATFDCVDSETGYYYGAPTNVLAGTKNLTFTLTTNLIARIRKEPREIQKIVSTNCYVQRSETYKKYLLESTAIESWLPEWKLEELENMMCASTIEINDHGARYGVKQYLLEGDATIGERVYACWDLFRYRIPLRECTIITDFSCGNCISANTKTVVIPTGKGNRFLTQNRELIGDYDNLLSYYTGLGFEAEDTTGTIDNTEHSFTLTGRAIPYVYADEALPQNRLYPTDTPITPVITCMPFAFGYAYSEEMVCADFEMLYAYEGDSGTPEQINIVGTGDWATIGTVDLFNGIGTINLTAQNHNVTLIGSDDLGGKDYTGNDTDTQVFADLTGKTLLTISMNGQNYNDDFFTQTGTSVELMSELTFTGTVTLIWISESGSLPSFVDEAIGVMELIGRPSQAQYVDIGNGNFITISTNGVIYFTGVPDSVDEDGAHIELTNVYYNL